jgi:pimeloyl-ACP methyl ester carboxylesterase
MLSTRKREAARAGAPYTSRAGHPPLWNLVSGGACALAIHAGATARITHAAPAADSARHFQIAVAPRETLHVVTDGDGPPVVLIPGLFGSAFGFRKVIPLLTEAGYRSIVVEPLGIGTSGRPERADYSLTAQADRVAAVLDTLRTGPTIVIGHSIGGAIAFRLAVRHPQMVKAIVSIEGGPSERAATPALGRAMRLAPLIRLFGGMSLMRRQLRHRLIASSGDTTWITDSVIRGYTAGAARDLGATLRAYRAMADSRESEPLRLRLAEIACPVRMLVGGARHEGNANSDELELLHRSLRSFTVDTQPGAGHFIFEEQPAAIVAEILRLPGGVGRPAPPRARTSP